ncbi:MAG TPA: class A beta-lactamase [Phenylobacterium sp.]|jgi:beta-lactamase class A|uniref:class A beta-lactamase n=1 Tax=Phenylobacterium sp. TaxID=1871053 RepID=UPI002B8DF590|nr:class A beta-lactamase [Phenylobacterium sp.]HXA39223.1 class A beta-lactamase [Phenylobacterium sp.]
MAIAMLASCAAPAAFAVPDALHPRLKALELEAGGRIGLAVLDTGSNRRIAYREGERFAMCSTFKLLLAAAVLHRVDQGRETLGRRIAISKADLLPVSPGTEPHVGGSLDVASLCEAAMIYSDNAAANLLLRSVGGPSGVTAFARTLGDPVTRLDHAETDLNKVAPGEVHDTTTPAAMLGDLQALLVGDALSPASRQRLTGWMVANRTGDDRLRAGAPKAWRVGDKTGAWLPKGGVNDLAAFWPPGRQPILIAAYTYGAEGDMAQRSAPLAEIGRLVAAWAEAV